MDQSIQLGESGGGIIFQLQAYRELAGGVSGYISGWYLLTPREKTAVASPLVGVPLSVPDVYFLPLRDLYPAITQARHFGQPRATHRRDTRVGFGKRQQWLPQTGIQSLSRSRSGRKGRA